MKKFRTNPQGFKIEDTEHMYANLKVSIWSSISLSSWFLKFEQVVTFFGFKKNVVDQCIYLKASGVSSLLKFFMLMTS